MVILLKVLAGLVNHIHDFLIILTRQLGLGLSDKDLHFWVIGFIGIAVFLAADILFRFIARWSISAISFIYTITVLVVFVFALEIEQKITGRGRMEFADIAAGLWGFIVLFVIYLTIKGAIFVIREVSKKRV